MSLEEVGAYHLLLNHQWMNGDIPEKPGELAFILGRGCTPEKAQALLSSRIGRKFSLRRHGRLYNKRLHREKVAQEKRRKQQSEAGKKGMKNRYRKEKEKPSTDRDLPNTVSNPVTNHDKISLLTKSNSASASASATAFAKSSNDDDPPTPQLSRAPPPDQFAQLLIESWGKSFDDDGLGILRAEQWIDLAMRQIATPAELEQAIPTFVKRLASGGYRDVKAYGWAVLKGGGLAEFLRGPLVKTTEERSREVAEIFDRAARKEELRP